MNRNQHYTTNKNYDKNRRTIRNNKHLKKTNCANDCSRKQRQKDQDEKFDENKKYKKLSKKYCRNNLNRNSVCQQLRKQNLE